MSERVHGSDCRKIIFRYLLSQMPKIVRAAPVKADSPIDRRIAKVLQLVREHLAMDVIFVAHYEDDINVVTYADSGPGAPDMKSFSQPRAESFCQRVLDGRLPRVIPDAPELRHSVDVPSAPVPIGAYMAAPVVLQDETLYGTLCCFSTEPNPTLDARHYKRLEIAARLTARLIDEASGKLAATAPDY